MKPVKGFCSPSWWKTLNWQIGFLNKDLLTKKKKTLSKKLFFIISCNHSHITVRNMVYIIPDLSNLKFVLWLST